MGVIAEGIPRGCQGLFTPVSLGYPLSVFNKNSTLKATVGYSRRTIFHKDFCRRCVNTPDLDTSDTLAQLKLIVRIELTPTSIRESPKKERKNHCVVIAHRAHLVDLARLNKERQEARRHKCAWLFVSGTPSRMDSLFTPTYAVLPIMQSKAPGPSENDTWTHSKTP